MSTFYKYEFISPTYIYAKVKEELKSYFDTGAVDDLLFPIWTKDALRKLSKAALPIKETVLYIEDFSAILPRGFNKVREAWICTTTAPVTIRKPGAYYSQVITLLNPEDDPCKTSCVPLKTELIYKATTEESYTSKLSHLLKPGNISAYNNCEQGCNNLFSSSADTFDIRDGKFVTNFRTGDVYLRYYSKDLDENNYQLIPENEAIEGYIEAFIKAKVFEQLWNQVTDETYNQIQNKWQVYEQKKDEAYVMAHTEIKKQTTEQKIAAIVRQGKRFNSYKIR